MTSSNHPDLFALACAILLLGCSSGGGSGVGAAAGTGGFGGVVAGGGAGGVGASGSGGAGASAGSGGASGAGGSGAAPACPPGLPGSFQQLPTGFSLPPTRCSADWRQLSQAYAPVRYALVDVSGDQRSDLVVYQDDCDAALGSTRWDAYLASDAGFAVAPAPLSLPPPRCGVSFDQIGSSYAPLRYALLDLTGDQFADLVVYSDDCDAAVGASRWDVYPGSASGFAASPIPYSLPAPRCQVEFDQLGQTYTPLRYSLLDLTGDARPDLVVEHDDCDPAVGTSRWDVYAGSASGFSPNATPFSLPAPRCQVEFDQTSDEYGALHYALIDLDAKGISDLVVYHDDCDTAVGTSRWDVYFASASGFSPAPAPYTLPAPRCQTPFDAPAEAYGGVHWSLVDLSCDSQPDLVVTSDSCDAELGQSRWDVYLGGPSGFAPQPSSLGLPAARCQSHFDAPSDAYGGAKYSLSSFDAEQRPALVVYDDDCDTDIGVTRWDAYQLQ